MKRTRLNIAMIMLITLGVSSCKNGAKETKTSEPKQTLAPTQEATSYRVTSENSTIAWLGSKPTGNHTGTISIKEGTFYLQAATIESGKFVIEMNSITVTDLKQNSGKESLESHLKGTVEGKEGDFFNVMQYPTATFEVTGVADVAGKTMMSGNLTMLSISQNISFPVKVTSQDNMIQVKSETFTIDRTKWGINYGSKSIFDNLGDKFIDDDMEITIDVTAVM
tara:strand:+ start:1012 stop:1680 length:669 start_codon:yes stop_codon:yes gene_type:complete